MQSDSITCWSSVRNVSTSHSIVSSVRPGGGSSNLGSRRWLRVSRECRLPCTNSNSSSNPIWPEPSVSSVWKTLKTTCALPRYLSREALREVIREAIKEAIREVIREAIREVTREALRPQRGIYVRKTFRDHSGNIHVRARSSIEYRVPELVAQCHIKLHVVDEELVVTVLVEQVHDIVHVRAAAR